MTNTGAFLCFRLSTLRFFSGFRTSFGVSGHAYFGTAYGVYHEIESQTGLRQGNIFASKLHHSGSPSVVCSAMLKRKNVLVCPFPDDVSLAAMLSEVCLSVHDSRAAFSKIDSELEPCVHLLFWSHQSF